MQARVLRRLYIHNAETAASVDQLTARIEEGEEPRPIAEHDSPRATTVMSAPQFYLNKEDNENEDAVTTGALSAICG